MNQNPWFIEQTAKYEMSRIHDDVDRIRQAQAARKSGHVMSRPARQRASHAPLFKRFTLTLIKVVLAMIG